MKILKLIVVCTLIVFVQSSARAQSLSVGTIGIEDYYRRSQLSGTVDTNVSFTVRPLFPGHIDNNYVKNTSHPDSNTNKYRLLSFKNIYQTNDTKFRLDLLPFTVQTQFTSNHPYGWNDGPMIPAKGLEALVSPGIFASYGPLTIQFKPEFVTAQNSGFDTFNKNSTANAFIHYYNIYNNIDLPARFGTSAYTKIYWGQSSIRLNYKAISFGLSTENLWWGPGIQSSLLMSNTAPGFPHLTLNTLRPLQTPIGSFEGQVIAGNLDASGYPPLEPDHIYNGTNLYYPKPNFWRYNSDMATQMDTRLIPGV